MKTSWHSRWRFQTRKPEDAFHRSVKVDCRTAIRISPEERRIVDMRRKKGVKFRFSLLTRLVYIVSKKGRIITVFEAPVELIAAVEQRLRQKKGDERGESEDWDNTLRGALM